MNKRIDALSVLGFYVLLGLALMTAKAHATCKAVCPEGYTHTGKSCPHVNGKCSSKKCLGAIACVDHSSATTVMVACTCH